MGWKQKEKQLTKEEAIAAARSELAKFWFGSLPLLAAVNTGTETAAFPLDPIFEEKTWILAFIDPTTETGQSVVSFVRTLFKRYSINNIAALLVVKPVYDFIYQERTIELFIRKQQISFPIVIDKDGLISSAFQATANPSLIILNKTTHVIRRLDGDWAKDVERELQTYLRSNDPGLALLPLLESTSYPSDLLTVDFGKDRGATFPAPGFTPLPNGFYSGSFNAQNAEELKAGRFRLNGKWVQDKDRIFTQDKEAEIEFLSPTPGLSIVAQSMTRLMETAKIVVSVDDAPAYEAFAAQDLSFDDDGVSMVKVEGPRLYRLLSSLPINKRKIRLRFPLANLVAVGVYGLRFTDLKREGRP